MTAAPSWKKSWQSPARKRCWKSAWALPIWPISCSCAKRKRWVWATQSTPFVVIYGDDVIWGEDPVCAQLIRAYEEFGRPVAGVSAVPWEDVSRYCSLKTTPIHDNYFFVDDMIEKPKKGQEFSNYSILGRVLLTPEIYEILAHTKPGAGGEIQLTDAMAEYARTRGGMTAVEFTGKHYDMGNKLKVVEAQVELALQHPEIGEEFRAYLKEFCKTL